MKIKENGQLVTLKKDELIPDPSISALYKKNDKIYKMFYNLEYNYSSRLDKEVFDFLKDTNFKAFMNLDKTFSYKNGVYVENDNCEVIDGYSYDYIERQDTKMIDLPMGYTLRSMGELVRFVQYLNQSGIAIVDPHSKNCIVGKDNLVIIDPDYFELDNYAFERNLNEMNSYLSDLWCDEYGIKDLYDRQYVHKLFYNENIDSYLYKMNLLLDEETPREFLDGIKRLNKYKTIKK